jgi:3-mercaptopyruvate sulfurtransferase SseA
MALQPGDTPAPRSAATEPGPEANEALKDPALRISLEQFVGLATKGAVTIVDVRGGESFADGHIPGALLIPLGSIEGSVEQLRGLRKPVVTYCS